jgi:XRE family aerobic/anaerobic benzoate catabolism transcriptional regulator
VNYIAAVPPTVASDPERLLHDLGREVRVRRRRRGWTLKEAAAVSGLSTRFLADVEAGRGNISVARLADLARALGCRPGELLDAKGPRRIALLGLRGAGKSTVGRLLAARLAVPFVELDQRVEEAAGLPLAEVFAVHGEAYYRRLEREVLARLLASNERFVLAAGGGIVNDAETFALLRGGCTTVWLRARPDEHMARVAAQGDLRPMARRADALAELKGILAARSALYAQADHEVPTSGATPAAVAERVAAAV